MKRDQKDQQRLETFGQAYRQLTAQLAQVGYICKGSVVRQMLTCGKPTCACPKDKTRRHGPYAYWSTKVGGKTVSRKLPPEEADLYEEWIENRRRMQAIIRKMLALSRTAAPLLLRRSAEDRTRRK